MKHHKYSPSKLFQVKACPGSVRMQEGIPEEKSADADYGTAIHKAIEVGSPAGLTLEQEGYYQQCIELLTLGQWKHEVEVSLMDDELNEITAGTVDAVAETDDYIVAYDWKFGRNTVTETAKNLQCMSYAAGLMQAYGKRVEFHIYQPTLHFHSVYTFQLSELPTIIAEIQGIIEDSETPALILNAGIEQCRYCKAKDQCPAYRKFALADSTSELMAVEHTHELSNEGLIKFYLQWQDYKSRYNQLSKLAANMEHTIEGRLLKNEGDELMQYFSLKPKLGNRKVTDANSLFSEVSDVLPADQFLKCVDVRLGALEETYCEVKKLLQGTKKTESKKALNEIINKYSERKSDGYKLIFKDENNKQIEGENENA